MQVDAHAVQGSGRTLAHSGRIQTLASGGTQGNEALTALTGATLIVLLAVIGVSILRIGQLMFVHLFVGLLLLGPLALKLASTGYRFVRYYSRDAGYRRKGPPILAMRLIAPVVVVSTLGVFVSGIVLLFVGPSDRSLSLLVHKASFFVWIAATAPHVIGHLPSVVSLFTARSFAGTELAGLRPGRGGRAIALAGALIGGLVLSIALIPEFSVWTHRFSQLHGAH